MRYNSTKLFISGLFFEFASYRDLSITYIIRQISQVFWK